MKDNTLNNTKKINSFNQIDTKGVAKASTSIACYLALLRTNNEQVPGL